MMSSAVFKAEGEEAWLCQAIELASASGRRGQVPVAAVAVRQGDAIEKHCDETLTTGDDTSHAAMMLLRKLGCATTPHEWGQMSIFISKEPCLMCREALRRSGVGKVVCGASSAAVSRISPAGTRFRTVRLSHPVASAGLPGSGLNLAFAGPSFEERALAPFF